MPTSRLEIDLGAIDRNLARLRAVTSHAQTDSGTRHKVALCAVIKQDAYGLGAARIAKRLAVTGAGVDMLAVYGLDEARALVDVPVTTPILVLMPVWTLERADALYRLAVLGRLHLALHSIAQARELSTLAGRIGLDLPVHVQVDTGLSRGGVLADEAFDLVQFAAAAPRLRLAGVMTHFASPAEDEAFTREQARTFRAWIERIKPTLATVAARHRHPMFVHAANTVGTLRSSQWHATMVRVGQGLLGYGAEALEGEEGVEFAGPAAGLEPCVRWVSRISHVQEVPGGWPVGYDRTFVTSRPSKIALVPVGYANGYPRALSNNAQVHLTGARWDRPRTSAPDEPLRVPTSLSRGGSAAGPIGEHVGCYVPLVGRVSMDQITIDVTGVPGDLCAVGAEVELVSARADAPNHLPVLAGAAGTITHELLCRVNQSVERVYINSRAEGTAGHAPATVSVPARGVIGSPSPQVVVAGQRRVAVG